MPPPRLLLACCLALAASQAGAFDLQGHRGARGLAPENTLPGFARALGVGVTTLETDIAITRDDVLVISHDPALNPEITRGPDGKFLAARGPVIRQLRFDELQRYDVGRLNPALPYASRYPDQQAADGARIPRLAQLFALLERAGGHDVRLALEIKTTPFNADETVAPEPFAQALVAAVRAAGLPARTSILSFDWRALAAVQALAPEIETVYLTAQQPWLDNVRAGTAEGSAWTAGVQHREHGSVPKMVRAAGGRTWSAFFGDLDAAAVREAHALGLKVLAWTVNAPADIERMLDLGVDGIVSDRPDRVRDALQRRGRPLPARVAVSP
ncbi:MAG TPA: glycerophosphodiester phosphodiesterase [Burkholderiaceae bacterium]|nr:glycerophosphodiester phosphodiesterase [Burkholderiaceae bacterium]